MYVNLLINILSLPKQNPEESNICRHNVCNYALVLGNKTLQPFSPVGWLFPVIRDLRAN